MKACQTFVGWELLMRSGRARITAQSGERRKGLTLFSVGAREFSFSRKRRCRCCGTRQCCPCAAGMWMVANACPVQTADCYYACAYLFACAFVLYCTYTLTKSSDCTTRGLLASDPSCRLVWNMIYLQQPVPSAGKTKMFIDQPTAFHYLLISCPTYSL